MTLPFAPSYSLQVYLGNVLRRERNPAGRGDRGRERGWDFPPLIFLSLAALSRRDGQLFSRK